MGETHLISGLKGLRAERLEELQRIRREIQYLSAKAAGIEDLIGHVDGVLTHVAPDLPLDYVAPMRTKPMFEVVGGREHQETSRTPTRTTSGPQRDRAEDEDDNRGRHDDGKRGERPVIRHILRILRLEGFPMTAKEVVEIVSQGLV